MGGNFEPKVFKAGLSSPSQIFFGTTALGFGGGNLRYPHSLGEGLLLGGKKPVWGSMPGYETFVQVVEKRGFPKRAVF